jgi:hypothetical protein
VLSAVVRGMVSVMAEDEMTRFYLDAARLVLNEIAPGQECELKVVETSLLPCTEKPEEPSTSTPDSPKS